MQGNSIESVKIILIGPMKRSAACSRSWVIYFTVILFRGPGTLTLVGWLHSYISNFVFGLLFSSHLKLGKRISEGLFCRIGHNVPVTPLRKTTFTNVLFRK